MERSVSGLFADNEHATSVVGALRADGIDAQRITVTSPDGTIAGSEIPMSHGIGAWLAEHLLQRDHAHEQPQQVKEGAAPNGWLVSVSIKTDEEDRSVRNLLVTAGAQAISSQTDGTMIPIERPVGAGAGPQ